MGRFGGCGSATVAFKSGPRMTGSMLDIALLCFFVFISVTGWRRGLLVSGLSLAGVVTGAFVARGLLAAYTSGNKTLTMWSIAGEAVVALGALALGSAFGAFVGRRLRAYLKWKTLLKIDSFGGALTSFATWSIVTWLITSLLLATPSSAITSALDKSRVTAALDTYMPQQVRDGMERIRGFVSDSHLPTNLTGGLLSPQVDAPDSSVIKSKGVKSALDGVVRVEGIASLCKTRLTGTGFVIDGGFVITNAHVVSGVDRPGVRLQGKGRLHSATVIYFDPKVDIAVLKLNDVVGRGLSLTTNQSRGTDVVVAGFPGGGKLSLIPARVRSVSPSKGTDIYGKGMIIREIYALRADIKQGDSGAPMLTSDGRVAGMVFASAANDALTGYALTTREFADALKAIATHQNEVSTGKCSNV